MSYTPETAFHEQIPDTHGGGAMQGSAEEESDHEGAWPGHCPFCRLAVALLLPEPQTRPLPFVRIVARAKFWTPYRFANISVSQIPLGPRAPPLT